MLVNRSRSSSRRWVTVQADQAADGSTRASVENELGKGPGPIPMMSPRKRSPSVPGVPHTSVVGEFAGLGCEVA